MFQRGKTQIMMTKNEGKRLIFCDTVQMGSTCIPKTCWSSRGKNMQYDKKAAAHKPVRAVVAVSYEKGIESMVLSRSAITSRKWL